MHKRLITALIFTIVSLCASFTVTASADDGADADVKAYAELGKPIKTQNMEFVDGMERGIADSTDPLYSEDFSMEGVAARKVYRANYLYFKVNKDFYQSGDSRFLVLVEYWDFGPDPGWFHVEYNSTDNNYKRVSIQKTGKVQKWCTARIYVTDADFGGKMEENADIRLVSNAFNAFSKITLINIDALQRSGKDIDIGTANDEAAEILHSIGLYSGISESEYDAGLDKELTRYDMISLVLDGTGQRKKALNDSVPCTFTDVTGDRAAVIGYAQKAGLVSGSGDDKFRPDDKATVREMLTVYLRMIGYSKDDIYENAMALAEEKGIIKSENLVLFADKPLKRDNFAAAAYNVLNIKNEKDNRSVIDSMVKNEYIDKTILKGTEFESSMYTSPVKVEKRKIHDTEVNRDYWYMNINGSMAVRPYVTSQHWKSDGSKFIISNNTHGMMYEYDVNTEMLRKLDDTALDSGALEAMVTPYDKIFYRKHNGKDYYLMDWNTYETHKVGELPDGVTTGVPSVTNDAKYATTYWIQAKEPADYLNGVNRYRIIPRLDLETGEWDTSITHEFDSTPDFPHVGHPNINPENPDLLMFCHEGTTQYIHDRIWLADVKTKEQRVLFKQAKLSDELTGETTGHEIWAKDGQSVFFVKYYIPSQNIGQQGVVRVNLDGEREYINNDYRYWHCYPSADNNWVAADTQNGSFSEIVLINTNTYESHRLAKFKTLNNPQHPYQPHPVISYDGHYVSWQMIDENGMLGVGWADISEFTKDAKTLGHKQLSEDVTIFTGKDSVSDTEEITDNGEVYYRAEPGNGVYCDIAEKADPTEAKKVTLRITYLDNGRQPLSLYYTSNWKSDAELANRENKSIKIERTNTRKWKTCEITIDDMNLGNAGKFKTDFYITGSQYSNVNIKNVEVVK